MRLAVFAAVLLSTTPAMAVDAITYKGTLGRSNILVELTDPAAGMMEGRYSYLRVGGDIPLHNLDGIESFELAEEAPCSEETCVLDADGMVPQPPIGGHWVLDLTADGKGLAGTWAPADKPGKTSAITLTEIGRRTLPEGTEINAAGLADSAFMQIHAAGTPISAETAPYDFAKMDVGLTEGDEEGMDGSSFRFVSDPRTVFAFPRVVSLADGSSPDAANRALAQRHAAINFLAFSCLNNAYAGLTYSGYDINMEGGSLGDYEYETVGLSYLSPTVLGWTESGSTWCGGAHPNNHFYSFLIDVKTGRELPLARIFNDWVATSNIANYDASVDPAAAMAAPEDYYWTAGQPLIDYVRANHTLRDDAEYIAQCDPDTLIGTNLGIRFAPGDKVVFTLEDLPHAIHACTDDLVTVPLADIPELLAPTAADYFPSLAR